MPPIAILLYNRPYAYFDAMPLSEKTKVAFVGWPVLKSEHEGKDNRDIRDKFRKYFVDFNEGDVGGRRGPEDKRQEGVTKREKQTRISNIIRDAVAGSIVVVPRQKKGCVYLGRVKDFELFDNIEWLNAEEYTSMPRIGGRRANDKDCPAAIEVAQGWNVENWVKVSLTILPRWLQGKLNQQNVPCRLHGYKGMEAPFDIFNAMMNERKGDMEKRVRQYTQEVSSGQDIEKRLLERIGPTDFEFLVRDLMICERPDLLWETGGKLADGGVDVAGFDKKTMAPKVLIQCKWQWNGQNIHLATPDSGITKEIFVLVNFDDNSKIDRLSERGVEYRGKDDIIALVRKHAKLVPLLRSIGIGEVI